MNKKISILYVLEVLKNYSDENHLLSQRDIISKLDSMYGIKCERKTIGANIDSLIQYGYDIIKTKLGCYLASRELEPSEIQFINDAIFSSKSIDARHSKDLIEKTSQFLSYYQRKQYKHIYKVIEVNKANNKEIFYNIDIINEAIENNKQIQFEYKKYYFKNNEKKNLFTINPYFLINNQGKYYLVCNNIYFDDVANYKVERIHNIKILDSKLKPVTELKGYEKGFNIAKYVNENIYMFSSNTIRATIKLRDNFSTTYVEEWFGNNATFFEKDSEIFASIKANETSLIYWCLQYGGNVELLEPTSCRNKIKSLLDDMYKKYNK